MPAEGEKLQILDVSKANPDPRVQKALKKLAAAKAPTSLSQLVMWRVAADLDWNTIFQLSRKWANRFEIALAQDFVDHLDDSADGETGRLLFEVEGTDAATKAMATEFTKALQGKMVLGLVTAAGIPAKPAGPTVACKIRLNAGEASVQITGSDATAMKWVAFGKFSQPVVQENGKLDVVKFADALADGILNRLVRAQVMKGSAQREKGKLIYQIRIENASPSHPQWAGDARNRERGKTKCQGVVGHCHPAAPNHARSHARRCRQIPGAEKRHQSVGA